MYNVYAAYRNADMTEGRGPMVLDKVFNAQEDAIEYINGQSGVMGRKPHNVSGWASMGDWTVKVVPVFDSLTEAEEFDIGSLRESALRKLTPAERLALGL